MRWPGISRLWGRTPPVPIVTFTGRDASRVALDRYLEHLRRQYLFVRGRTYVFDDGTVAPGELIAWRRGADRPWSLWRYAQGSPEAVSFVPFGERPNVRG